MIFDACMVNSLRVKKKSERQERRENEGRKEEVDEAFQLRSLHNHSTILAFEIEAQR